MKFIAHRGACLEELEDTLAALERGAAYGAYAVECDPRWTADGVAVIFHDGNLRRLAGDPRNVSEITFDEMKRVMESVGKTVTTLDEVLENYHGQSAVLFDLPRVTDEAFFKKLADAPFHTIAGVHALDEAEIARKFFKQEDILAFMPKPDMAADFAAAGVGNIRLWEYWLPEYPISKVREVIPKDREIWIMTCDATIDHPLFSMNGSKWQIQKMLTMGADGMLLNDIALMQDFRA